MMQYIFALLTMLVLSLVPIPMLLMSSWPSWIVLFFFWLNFYVLRQHGYLWIWALGLMFDLLHGCALGVHVIALNILNLLITAHRHKFLLYPVLQQSILIMFGTSLYLFFSQLYLQDLSFGRLILYVIRVSLTTAFVWPWLEYYLTRPKRYAHRSL